MSGNHSGSHKTVYQYMDKRLFSQTNLKINNKNTKVIHNDNRFPKFIHEHGNFIRSNFELSPSNEVFPVNKIVKLQH